MSVFKKLLRRARDGARLAHRDGQQLPPPLPDHLGDAQRDALLPVAVFAPQLVDHRLQQVVLPVIDLPAFLPAFPPQALQRDLICGGTVQQYFHLVPGRSCTLHQNLISGLAAAELQPPHPGSCCRR